MLLSHPSKDRLKLPTRDCFSDGKRQQERAHGRAPWFLVPSSPPKPEEWRAQLSPHASSAFLQDSPVPQGSRIHKTHLIADAGEEMMGLAWKKLSSQLYRRTSLSSATSTHTSAEDSPAQLLQKLFLPAPLQQPTWFCGVQSHRQSTCCGSHLLPLWHGPDLSSWSITHLSSPHQAALPRQDSFSPELTLLWRKTPLAVFTPLVAGNEVHSGAAFVFPLTTEGLS